MSDPQSGRYEHQRSVPFGTELAVPGADAAITID
jgi:hypothetical protein